jgi:hypothetical protein
MRHWSEARAEASPADLYGGVYACRHEAGRNRGQRVVSSGYSAQQHRPDVRGIKGMAQEAGRDPSALELIVRANVELHNTPIQKDRIEFTGTVEQIAEDVTTARKLGAAEIAIDAQFSPGVETAKDIVARMEELWRVAKQA